MSSTPLTLRDFPFPAHDAVAWEETPPRRLNWPAEADGRHVLVQVEVDALSRLSGVPLRVDAGKARDLLLAHRAATQAAARPKFQPGDKIVGLAHIG